MEEYDATTDSRIISADNKFYVLPQDISKNLKAKDIIDNGGFFPYLLSKGGVDLCVFRTKNAAEIVLRLSDKIKKLH